MCVHHYVVSTEPVKKNNEKILQSKCKKCGDNRDFKYNPISYDSLRMNYKEVDKEISKIRINKNMNIR